MLQAATIWHLISSQLPRDRWVEVRALYDDLVERSGLLTDDDFEPAGPATAEPKWQRNVRNVLQHRKANGGVFWDGHGRYMVPSPAVAQELALRLGLWRELKPHAGIAQASPMTLRNLGISGGAQGIVVQKNRTSHLTEDGHGVTMAVLHLGNRYADDLSESELIYHYPETDRAPARDTNEVAATKNAATLRLPVFVILPDTARQLRTVRLGWVASWDDENRHFLILLAGEDRLRPMELLALALPNDEDPFTPFASGRARQAAKAIRSGQQRFKFLVLQRYGGKCAVCGTELPVVLDAAHIIPKERRGSDDPRNGLVLCANHHRAYDAHLFEIEPETTRLVPARGVSSLRALGILGTDLSHLPKKPHPETLRWRSRQRRLRQ